MSTALFLLDARFRPYVEDLLEVAKMYRLHPTVTSTFRSMGEQAILYRKYLAGEHPYPVAPPGQSMHNYGLAVDLISDDNAWLGQVWKAWGGRWNASDDIHFSV